MIMTIYTVEYRTRLEGWRESVHVLADNSYEAYEQVAQSKSRPIPLKVSLANEVDFVK
jgi:hypothetical protein